MEKKNNKSSKFLYKNNVNNGKNEKLLNFCNRHFIMNRYYIIEKKIICLKQIWHYPELCNIHFLNSENVS